MDVSHCLEHKEEKLCLLVLLHRPDVILVVDTEKHVRKDKWNIW